MYGAFAPSFTIHCGVKKFGIDDMIVEQNWNTICSMLEPVQLVSEEGTLKAGPE